MDGDRKYRQHGYQNGNSSNGSEAGDVPKSEALKPRFTAPRHPLDITAPRLPHMVQNVTASRCHNCANTLPAGFDFAQPCPKCAVELHCCRQCAHFDSSAHFQCAKPVAERIAAKDNRNDCMLFSPRVTVARESTKPPEPPKVVAAAPATPHVSRTVHNARTAFENLFKK
jgi:hypothetical protein